MEEYTLSFCKLIKHSESLLEVKINKDIVIDIKHAKEVNDILYNIFKKPYGVLVDVRVYFSVTFEGGVTIGNHKMEKRVALLANKKHSEVALRSVMHMQKTGFPQKELKIFYDRKSAIQWIEKINNP